MPSRSLEQEALDRVSRMYSSYDRRTRPNSPQTAPAKPEPAPVPPPEQEITQEVTSEKPDEKKQPGLLDILLRDKEQSLIMLLLVILMKDGADMNTVLALMYLLI